MSIQLSIRQYKLLHLFGRQSLTLEQGLQLDQRTLISLYRRGYIKYSGIFAILPAGWEVLSMLRSIYIGRKHVKPLKKESFRRRAA